MNPSKGLSKATAPKNTPHSDLLSISDSEATRKVSLACLAQGPELRRQERIGNNDVVHKRVPETLGNTTKKKRYKQNPSPSLETKPKQLPVPIPSRSLLKSSPSLVNTVETAYDQLLKASVRSELALDSQQT